MPKNPESTSKKNNKNITDATQSVATLNTNDDKTISSEKVKWLEVPEAHDYDAAASYLGLIYSPVTVTNIVSRLQSASMTQFKAKDVLRASGLPLLKEDNKHVKKDLAKIDDDKLISPILLVRDSVNGKVIIADGYHRVCAVYLLDEDELIPCQITGIEG